jgi:hypothetical protein
MSSIIRIIPRFIRVGLLGLIEAQVNEVDADDLQRAKEIIMARVAAILLL